MTAADTTEEDAARWHEAKALLEWLVEIHPRCIPVLVGSAARLLEKDAPTRTRRDAQRWRQVEPLLTKLSHIHPSSVYAEAVGTDEQVLEVVDEIQSLINTGAIQ